MDRETIAYKIPNLYLNIQTVTMDGERQLRGAHTHGAVELVRLDRGSMNVTVGQETVALSPGDVLLVHQYTVHKLKPEISAEVTYIQIDIRKYLGKTGMREFGYIHEFITKTRTKPYCIFNAKSEPAKIFERIEQEAESPDGGSEYCITGYIFLLMAIMSRNNMLTAADLSDRYLAEIRPVTEYIEKNYESKLYTDDLAARINCDKFRLCRIFKAATGGTVIDYVNFVRLRKAEEILISGQMNISETAFACGFSSVQYFNKVFKKQLGCAPGTFIRKSLHGK